jgi:hypothetical protein
MQSFGPLKPLGLRAVAVATFCITERDTVIVQQQWRSRDAVIVRDFLGNCEEH